MMKLTRLLPFGIALLTTLPLAAQTSEGGRKPANDRASDVPEARQSSPETRKRFEVRIAPEASGAGANAIIIDDMIIEPPMAPLPPGLEHLEELEMLGRVQPDSLRKAIELKIPRLKELRGMERMMGDSIRRQIEMDVARSMEGNAQLHKEMRRIAEEIRSKTREIRNIKSRAKGDTTGMSEALRLAQQSLDEARMSLRQLDSTFSADGSFQMPQFSVMVDTDAQGEDGEQRVMVMVNRDSSCVNNRNARVTTTTRSFIRSNGHDVLIFNGGDSLPCAAKAMAMARVEHQDEAGGITRNQVFILSNTDSTSANCFAASNGAGRSQVIIRNSDGTSSQALNGHSVYARQFTSDELPFAHVPPAAQHGASLPLIVRDNLILVGDDSVQIQDGKDRQMMIRVYRDSSSAQNQTSVVVITMSRQRTADVKADTLTGGTSAVENVDAAAEASASGYMLEANQPNPFSSSTAINFTIPRDTHVNLTVFDAAGTPVRVLKDEMTSAGSHTMSFDAGDLPSGLYFYRFVADGFSETKTMTVVK